MTISDEKLNEMIGLVEDNEAVDYFDLFDALTELQERREVDKTLGNVVKLGDEFGYALQIIYEQGEWGAAYCKKDRYKPFPVTIDRFSSFVAAIKNLE